MSKTVEEIGLIVAGVATIAVGGLAYFGLLAFGLTGAQFGAVAAIGLTVTMQGVGLALRPSLKPVGTSGAISVGQGPQPRRVIYGQFQTAGVLTYGSFPPSQNLAADNQYLHLVYTLAGHEITSFDAVIVNGTLRNFGTDLQFNSDQLWHVDPGGSSSFVDFYWQHMFFEFDFGRDSPVASFPELASVDGSWTSACIQRRCAKVHVILRYDAALSAIFQNGSIPNIQFLVTGKKIVDTRVVTAWVASWNYVQYQYVVDNRGIIWVQTTTAGTSGTSRPNFEGAGSFPATLSDNTASWTSYGDLQSAVTVGGDANPQGHLVNGRLMNNAWQPAVNYGQYNIIEAPVGYLQQQQTASFGGGGGLTGSTEPAFALTLGGTTTDGGITWKCLGRSWHAINNANPALVVNDYLQNTDWGMAAPLASIDVSSVSAAANICEEQAVIIWNSDGTTVSENLYSCVGMFDQSSVRGNVLDAMCRSMAGWVIPPGDLWHVFAGSYQTPTVTLGDGDMRGPIKGDFRLSRRDVCNSVKGKFVPAFLPTNPAGALSLTQVPPTWQAQSFPAYQANGLAGKPNFLNSEDGGQILWLDLQLDFVTSLWQAQRLAKIALMRTRFQQTLTLPCKLTALQLEAGDTFSFTHLRWGILGQAFEATQASVTLDTGGGSKDSAPVLGVDILARQTDPSIYEFQQPLSPSDFGEYSTYGITGVMTGVE